MMQESLADLAQLTQAVYQGRLSRLQTLLKEETRLRQDLKRLDQMQDHEEAKDAQDISLRALGADLLWQGWVMRQKTDLNMKLANVLVQKSAVIRDVKLAFGRAQVAETLHMTHGAKTKRKSL